MDRSTVRETFMRSSYVFNNSGNVNRSFISTALINDSLAYNDDLRKSRIQNLPNYKKINLGDNLQFIIVFQTIEIERLSNEVQVLRMKLVQTGRQLFNVQSYQEQIRQLTEKCFQMEKLRQQYCQQIDKLGKICQTLYHENENLKNKLNEMDFSLKQKFQSQKQRNSELSMQNQKWKNRYQAMQKSKEKELEDLKALMQNQRKSMIDREIRQMTIMFQNQRLGLENQIRKHRELLQNCNRQLNEYRQKCQKYEISIMELKNYENVIADNQNKIVLLNQELMRLRDQYSKKDLQLQDYKQRQYKLNQQLKSQQDWQIQSKQLKSSLQNKNKQIEEWRVRAGRLQAEVGKGRQLYHYNQELTDKLNIAAKQIERINNNLRAKIDENSQLRQKLGERQSQIAKFSNIENEIKTKQIRFQQIQAEADRSAGLLKDRLTEIQQWRAKYAKLQSNLNNLANIDREKKIVQQKLGSQIRNNEQMQGLIKRLEKDIITYKSFQNQFKEADRQNGAMFKQIQRLNNNIRNYSSQVDDYRTRLAKAQKSLSDNKSFELQIKDLQGRLNVSTQEKERLNTIIRDRNQALGVLEREKIEFVSKINASKNYEIRNAEAEQLNNRLKEEVNRYRKDIQALQAKLRQEDQRYRELQNNLHNNNTEKQKLSSMIKNKNNEYDELRSRYARLEIDSRKAAQLQMQVKQQHNQLAIYASDIDGFQRVLKEKVAQLQREKIICNQLAYKIIVLSCQIQRLSGNGQARGGINSREYKQLQSDYSRLQNKVTSKNNEIDILNNRIASLQNKVSELTREFTRLLQEAQKNQQETLMLVRRIQQYQDYARKIHILGAQLDRINALNKSLDEDARNIRLKFADGLAFEKKQQDFQLTIVLMGLQIENLRARVEERNMSVEQMRKSILEPVRRV